MSISKEEAVARLDEAQNRLTQLRELRNRRDAVFAAIQFPKEEDYFAIQKANWDLFPEESYCSGRIDAFNEFISDKPYRQDLVDRAIERIDNDPHPGYLQGYYQGLVELQLLQDDVQAEQVRLTFTNRTRY